jgi:thiamine-phosphate pyrophosphorylase
MGGIKEHHLPLLCAKGFKHIAMVTEITQAPDVEAKVRQLRQIMKDNCHE